MANFAAAYNAMVIKTCEKGRKDTKPRTVVDCSIGVAEMADVYPSLSLLLMDPTRIFIVSYVQLKGAPGQLAGAPGLVQTGW